jgi:hypothetical protein
MGGSESLGFFDGVLIGVTIVFGALCVVLITAALVVCWNLVRYGHLAKPLKEQI